MVSKFGEQMAVYLGFLKNALCDSNVQPGYRIMEVF